jgi:glycosyltransferase involved in cell wall biosynthesis
VSGGGVVHVYGAYVPSRTEGISANVHGLVRALRRAGVPTRQECAPVDLPRLNRHRALAAAALRAAASVARARREPGTALVHHHVSLLSTAAPARPSHAGRGRGPPVLLHAWNAYFDPGSAPGLPRADRLAHRLGNGPEAAALGLRGVRDLVVSSRHQARQVAALGWRGRLHVVPNGVDLERHRPRTPEEAEAARASYGLDGDPVLLYYGHATPWKGLRVLVSALPAVAREHPRLQVLLSLTGYGRDHAWLRRELAAHGLAGRVRIVGPDDVARLHAAADLAVLPAPAGVGSACFPNVLLECMAGGVPIVATRVGCVPEALRDGETGLLADPGSPGSLARHLSGLAGDPVLRRRMAAEARRAAEAGHGWDGVARAMLGVYRAVGVDVPAPDAADWPAVAMAGDAA